jgi:hypothetical protein
VLTAALKRPLASPAEAPGVVYSTIAGAEHLKFFIREPNNATLSTTCRASRWLDA